MNFLPPFSKDRPILVAGPCVAESVRLCATVARHMSKACEQHGFQYVFKASYDKANRTSGSSPRGPGLRRGLSYLSQVKGELGVLVLTDVHDREQAAAAATVVDVIQVPALLCRQTDLLRDCGFQGRAVSVKRAPCVPPESMVHAVSKVQEGMAVRGDSSQVLLVERGSAFGHGDLVVDPRAIARMARHNAVLVDASHSQGQYVESSTWAAEVIGSAGLASGACGVYVEVHPSPGSAECDGRTSVPLFDVPELLARWRKVWEAMRP